jgi:hypothetical protein
VGFFQRIKNTFGASQADSAGASPEIVERGVLIFHHTSEVIKAEELLRNEGFDIAVKGPPPEVRTGCDLAIEFPLIDQLAVVELLRREGVAPMDVLPLKDVLSEPVSLYFAKDFGDYLMVRAANMKITVSKADLTIVNVSGGGCPDVPYLADRLVGLRLGVGPEPREIGRTLCGYALQLAYEELRRRCGR